MEDIIDDNYKLAEITKGKGKKGQSGGSKKRKNESEGTCKLKGGKIKIGLISDH